MTRTGKKTSTTMSIVLTPKSKPAINYLLKTKTLTSAKIIAFINNGVSYRL